MTLADLLRAFVRRWPIVLVGVLLSVGVAYLATRTEPAYHARAEAVFLAPSSTRYPNELVTTTESIIISAGAVAKRLNGPDPGLKFGTQDVNPVGAPPGNGDTWIQLVDAGNQWVSNFDDQVLLIDSMGSTPVEAEAQVLEAAERIKEEVAALQREQGVDPINDITVRLSPGVPVVTEIDGSGVRAGGMSFVIGVILTAGLVVVLEVRSRRRESAAAPEEPHRRRGHASVVEEASS